MSPRGHISPRQEARAHDDRGSVTYGPFGELSFLLVKAQVAFRKRRIFFNNSSQEFDKEVRVRREP